MKNKCGRDFLYFALNFYLPERFNAQSNNPVMIDQKNYFGKPTPWYLAWTGVQFAHVGTFLKELGFTLHINDQRIDSYLDLTKAIILSRKTYPAALSEIEAAINHNTVVGVDLSLGLFGVFDHVIFVYGYDEENLYVFDTHKVAKLEYELMAGELHVYKLPKSVVQKRWTRFGRVWSVTEVN